MARRTAKAFREALRVAVVTASADLGTTRYRIPRRIGPFDRRAVCHDGRRLEQNPNVPQHESRLKAKLVDTNSGP